MTDFCSLQVCVRRPGEKFLTKTTTNVKLGTISSWIGTRTQSKHEGHEDDLEHNQENNAPA